MIELQGRKILAFLNDLLEAVPKSDASVVREIDLSSGNVVYYSVRPAENEDQ